MAAKLQGNYRIEYWEPIAFYGITGVPLVLEFKRCRSLASARRTAVDLARRKHLDRWQRVRQVDITNIKTRKRIHLKQSDFKDKERT